MIFINSIVDASIKKTSNQEKNTVPRKYRFDRENFGNVLAIWLVSACILFFIIILITIIEGKSNLLDIMYYTLKKVDALNISFSLSLSALLESTWHLNNIKYKIVYFSVFLTTIIGAILYAIFMVLLVVSPQNGLLINQFYINVVYIVISTIITIISFFSRSVKIEE